MDFIEIIEVIKTALLVIGAVVWTRYVYELALLVLKKRNIPNVRSVRPMRKKIVEILREDAEARGCKPYKVVDLGSGSGLLTQHIAINLEQSSVVGVERAGYAHFVSVLRQKLRGLKNLSYERSDLFEYDLSDADAVTFYLGRCMVGPVGEKLRRELKPGALVISNNFELEEGWDALEVVDVPSLYTHQTQLFVYRQEDTDRMAKAA